MLWWSWYSDNAQIMLSNCRWAIPFVFGEEMNQWVIFIWPPPLLLKACCYCPSAMREMSNVAHCRVDGVNFYLRGDMIVIWRGDMIVIWKWYESDMRVNTLSWFIMELACTLRKADLVPGPRPLAVTSKAQIGNGTYAGAQLRCFHHDARVHLQRSSPPTTLESAYDTWVHLQRSTAPITLNCTYDAQVHLWR